MRPFLAVVCSVLLILGIGNVIETRATTAPDTAIASLPLPPVPPAGAAAPSSTQVAVVIPGLRGHWERQWIPAQTTVTTSTVSAEVAAPMAMVSVEATGPLRAAGGRVAGAVGKIIGVERRQARRAARRG